MAKPRSITAIKDAARTAQAAGAVAVVNTIADELESIAAGMHALRCGRLNDRALLLLIQDAAPGVKGKKVSVAYIKAVLQGLNELRVAFVKKPIGVS